VRAGGRADDAATPAPLAAPSAPPPLLLPLAPLPLCPPLLLLPPTRWW
jgi:hypothetical protein